MALARVRDTARAVQTELKPQPGEEPDGGRQVARAAVDEVFENASRILERARARRRVAQPRPAPRAGAARGADERGDAGARQGLRRAHRRADLGDARARRRRSTPSPARIGPARRGRAGVARARRRQPVRLPASRPSPTWRGTCPRPAATASATETLDEIEALVRAAGGRTLGPVLVDARGQGGHRGDARAVRRQEGDDRVPLPGRGPDQHPGAPVRPRPAHLPVRHARRSGRASTCPARRASSSSSTASRSRAPTTRSPRRARRPSRGWAATASWRSRPPTRRCGWRRAPDGSSGGPTTAASSPSSTPG